MIVYLLHHKSSCSGKAGMRNAEETQLTIKKDVEN